MIAAKAWTLILLMGGSSASAPEVSFYDTADACAAAGLAQWSRSADAVGFTCSRANPARINAPGSESTFGGTGKGIPTLSATYPPQAPAGFLKAPSATAPAVHYGTRKK